MIILNQCPQTTTTCCKNHRLHPLLCLLIYIFSFT